jgi:hypothetical protein
VRRISALADGATGLAEDRDGELVQVGRVAAAVEGLNGDIASSTATVRSKSAKTAAILHKPAAATG